MRASEDERRAERRRSVERLRTQEGLGANAISQSLSLPTSTVHGDLVALGFLTSRRPAELPEGYAPLAGHQSITEGEHPGAHRLVRRLIRGGLDREALPAACALALELDRPGRLHSLRSHASGEAARAG